MTDLTPPNVPAPGRGLRLALGISIALNLAVAGVIGGAMLRGGPGGHGAMGRDLGFGPYAQALRSEDRAALRQALFARAPELRLARHQLHVDSLAIVAALRAEPFDPKALTDLLRAQQLRMAGHLKLGQEVLGAFLTALPANERLEYAQRLQDGPRQMPPPASSD